MQLSRKHKKRRSRSVLLVFLGAIFVVGLSFGGALLWQRVENSIADPPVSAPAQFEPTSDERPAIQPPANVVSPPLTAPPTENEEPTAQPPAEPSSSDFEPGPFAVAWQVQPSQPVDISYFDDAIFFGDSVSTGIIAYQVFRYAACVAAVGVTPQTALYGRYISTPQGPVTMLEAAQQKGEKSKVYIMLGSNGLDLDLDDFIYGYRQFISAVRAQYPSAVIYIQSMTPVAAHVGEHHPGVSRELVIEFNAAIAELARSNNLPFLNIFDALAGEDGYLPAHASRDGLHLSAEYHFIWLDFLRAHTVG